MSKIRTLIEFRGFEKIALDFERTEVCFAEAILPIVSIIRKYQNEGTRFEIFLPREERLARLFKNCGWSYLIDPQNFHDERKRHSLNLPCQTFTRPEEQDKLIDDIVRQILSKLEFLDRSHVKGIEWALIEVSDNVLNHSQSAVGGIIEINLRPRQQEIEFIVADSGIGIPESLRMSSFFSPDDPDDFLLEQSIREGVTRDTSVGQGNGLFGTSQIAALSHGTFHVNSGRAHLVIDRSGNSITRLDDHEFVGTQIVWSINYGRVDALETALGFSGRIRNFVDIIERKHEMNDRELVIRVSEQAKSVRNRVMGADFRRYIANVANMNLEFLIIIDFENVGLISSSFADEVFGRLANSLGIEKFRERFSFTNLQPVNAELIERAIGLRLQNG